MAADRAEHVATVLEPALARGRWVVSDRFTASTIAYQGYGRGLGIDELERVTAFAARGVEVDLQILLDVPVEIARSRMDPSRADRLEHLGNDFFELVRGGYLTMARDDSSHWAVLDGTRESSDIAEEILDVVTTRLGVPPAGARV